MRLVLLKTTLIGGLLAFVFGPVTALATSASPGANESRGKGASMNPDISVNALMLYRNSNRGNYIDSTQRNGPQIQEAELQIFSDVDPYSRLNALFSIHQDPPQASNGVTPREGEWKIEPEELFIDTTELPYVTVRAGKFKAFLGKHNTLHTHAFPFIDAPLINSNLLGEEGLNDVGLSASWLVPVPWFSELTAQVLSGRAGKDIRDKPYFNSANANTSAYVAHLKNLVDLSDDLTGELGLSGATGANEFADDAGVNQPGATTFYGADLTFKWRPMVGGKYHAATWATEYLNRRINRPTTNNQGDGFATWIQYQFAERWWAQLRDEYLQVADSAADGTALDIPAFQRKYSALIGYFPSEFSGVRLQYSHLDDRRGDPEKKILLQLNFTIGAHPAHSY